MAESVLFFIAGEVLVKISSLIVQQVKLAWGLDKELKKLEETLTSIKAVLLDAEEQQSQNRQLQRLLGRLKIFCYDADNVLDELEYHALRKRVLANPIKNKVTRSNSFVVWFNIGPRLKQLKETLDDIADQMSKFHLTDQLVDYRPAGSRQREMTDSLLRTSKVIGRDKDKEIVLKFLMNIDHVGSSSTVSVIPIVGMRGMGKTTFAKFLYNDVTVNECFQLKIWICAPENFDKKILMDNLIKSLTNQNQSTLDPDQLQAIIQAKLNGKRFLLVLDDVWSDDRKKWLDLKDLLEGGALGSKVIVTTCNASVAKTVGTAPPYNLNGLSHEDCLSLFKKCVFREGEEESYPHLMKIGNDIVTKCRGLPLVVTTLGNFLYSKYDKHYWENIKDNEIWKLELSENNILPALRLSYDQMPSHLKPCFLICSLYPKGYVFNTIELGPLWMAHGLLRPTDDMDKIAMQYVKELHSRSFFQDLNVYGNLFYEFTMHDLVHDLALYLAQTESSLVTVGSNSICKGARHIIIPDEGCIRGREIQNHLCKENNLQTLIFPPDAGGPSLASFLNTCISNCTYLRMLKLSECSFELLPSSIGNLKHLRYLDLNENPELRRLPDSMGKLHNMLVLSINYCPQLEELPRKIRNLINLRVLEISVKQKHLQEDGIWRLTSLRTLKIENCPNLEFSFERIKSFTSLRDLRIINCSSLDSLSRNLRCLRALKILHIQGCHQLKWMEEEEDDNQDVEVSSLEILFLNDLPQLKTLPRWVKKCSTTLQCLCIADCENFSSMPAWLHYFTELKSLVIYNCPMIHIWDEFSLMEEDDNQGIKWNLQNLIFSKLPQLVTLPQWVKKYSKTLQKLRILGCQNFSSFPEWFKEFTSLNTLIIEGCQELRTAQHLYKIAHVPDIYITDYFEELDLKIGNIFWPRSWI